jgi:hypothetical protein
MTHAAAENLSSKMTPNVSDFQSIRAFYKGTSLQAPVNAGKELEFLQQITKDADAQIRGALNVGGTLKDVGDVYMAQLDYMEQRLSESLDTFFPSHVCPIVTTCDKMFDWVDYATEKFDLVRGGGIALWFINILVLMKLKRLQDDDMNGIVIVTTPTTE